MVKKNIEKKINNEIYNLIACFCVHLFDTHGIPKQIFKEKFMINEYWNLKLIFKTIDKNHKDFKKYYFKKKGLQR